MAVSKPGFKLYKTASRQMLTANSPARPVDNAKDNSSSWYKYSYEDEGSMTPVSVNDDVPLNFQDSKIKFRTFRHLNTKSLLENAKAINENKLIRNADNDGILSKIQQDNDIEK